MPRNGEDRDRTLSRGRRRERSGTVYAHDVAPQCEDLSPHNPEQMFTASIKPKSKTRDPYMRIFGPRFEEIKETEPKKKDSGDGWKEFKRGTYTFPISFTIPSTAPPTLQCDFGSVVWKLHAEVHRPGAFKSKYTASREVQVITCPTEEDTEDSENIIVERHWDQQLQYLISISGRAFPIGGTVPVTLAFLPLAKVKIYRLSIVIEGSSLPEIHEE